MKTLPNLSRPAWLLLALPLLASCGGESGEAPEAAAKPAKPAPTATMGELLELEGKPPIVFISIDTLRADHLHCYGYERETSPHLDAFAADSVLFERAISQAAVTAPAHMSLFTGLTPSVHRVFNHRTDGGENTVLAPDIKTLAEMLRDNGYATYGFTGGGNVASGLGFDRGFDKYTMKTVPWYEFRTAKAPLAEVDEAIEAVAAEGKPLFLFLHHYACHSPYVSAPEEDLLRFLPEPVEGLPVSKDDVDDRPKGMSPKQRFWRDVDLSDPEHLNHIVSLYDGGVYYSDFVFSRMIEMLRRHDLYDDAIIVVTSDHGEEFFEHGSKLHWKLFLHTLHVPFIIKFPGGKFANRRVAETIRSFDVMPTLLEAAGIELPTALQATSLAPLLADQAYDPIILSYANQEPIAIRFQEDKYAYSNQRSAGREEWLFDLESDPGEQRDLAQRNQGLLVSKRARAVELLEADQSLSQLLKALEGQTSVPSEEMMQELEALGYIR